MKSNLKLTIIFFLLSLITLVSSIFAWVSLSKQSNVGGIGGNISDFTDIVVFEVKRSGDPDFTLIKTIDDMHVIFGDTRPGETYTFKIIIENRSAKSFEVFSSINGVKTIYLKDENNIPVNPNFDLRDVFYIKEGKVNFTTKGPNDEVIETSDNISASLNNNDSVTEYEQVLNLYRLNNLIDQNGNISLFSPRAIEANHKLIVEFTLVYDASTKRTEYQDNQLNFEGIYLYGQ